ncbi:MAG: hypothetical protein KJ915_07995 [Candidatus Omnitrophica bacterium]|nr:hypothetical protein [Candidatus Omnitrophota bacterium]
MKNRVEVINIALIIILLFFTSGCSAARKELRKADDKIFTHYGEFDLVRKNNDLYFQKPDGSHNIRLTFTPQIKENSAFIASSSGYLVYSAFENPGKPEKYYMQNMDIGFKSRKTISKQEFNRLLLIR